MNNEINTFTRVQRTWIDKVRNTFANLFTLGFWEEWKNKQLENALFEGNYDKAKKAILCGANRYHAFKLLLKTHENVVIRANVISFYLAQFKNWNSPCYRDFNSVKEYSSIFWDHHKTNFDPKSIKDFVFHILPSYFDTDFDLANTSVYFLDEYKIVDTSSMDHIYRKVTSNCRCSPRLYSRFLTFKSQVTGITFKTLWLEASKLG